MFFKYVFLMNVMPTNLKLKNKSYLKLWNQIHNNFNYKTEFLKIYQTLVAQIYTHNLTKKKRKDQSGFVLKRNWKHGFYIEHSIKSNG